MKISVLHAINLITLLTIAPFATPAADVPAEVAPATSHTEIEAGLKSHDHALYIRQRWIRDPYITVGPDHLYYLTGTTPNPGDPRELSDPFNTGLGKQSIVGSAVRVWRSKDLVDWEYLGEPFTMERDSDRKNPGKILWAPELHWLDNSWALVFCPQAKADFAISAGPELKGPWRHPLGDRLGDDKHDPSLFKDDDGTWWFIWKNTFIAPFSKDFTHFTAEPTHIDPAGSRPDPQDNTRTISRIGHEGTTILKIGKKYVFIGTGWSTDMGRKGSYNLYYCTADKITGPYGSRKFLGRFLGHGTPFQTLDGQWWCTAFYNANVPPLPREGIEKRDLSEDAQTINQRGLTIVPLDVKVQNDGNIYLRAIDPAYGTPGPDEAQKFSN
jgi:hypothetical protein